MSAERASRWYVLFSDGSIEPIVEETGFGPDGDLVRLSILDKSAHYLDHAEEIAFGAMGLFHALVPRGARYLIDATTIGRDLATLSARFGAATP